MLYPMLKRYQSAKKEPVLSVSMRPSSALAPPVTSVALSAVLLDGAVATSKGRCCVLCRARLFSFGRPLGTPSDQALAALAIRRSFIMLAFSSRSRRRCRLHLEG